MNKTLKKELIYKGPVCTFTHNTVTFEDDSVGYRDVLNLPGAVAILAFKDDSTVLLVEQFRHAIEQSLLELPAGMLEKGEDPKAAALRELQEETGYKAENIELLQEFFTSPGVVNEKIYIYLATDLTFVGQHLDADEYLNVRELTVDQLEEMMADGKIQDGKTLIGYLRWKNLKK